MEQRAYSHPGPVVTSPTRWYPATMAQLMADDHLLGYFQAGHDGVDEVHPFNITVTPEYQRQGWPACC